MKSTDSYVGSNKSNRDVKIKALTLLHLYFMCEETIAHNQNKISTATMAITATAMIPPAVQRYTIAPHRCHPNIIAYL